MILTRDHWILLAVTLLYIIGFGAYFLLNGNYEFVWYVVVMVGLLAFIGLTLRRSQLPLWILWLLSIWGFMHMAGGGIRIDDHVLYAQILLPLRLDGEFSLIKYDQLVHAYGFGVAALAVAHILRRVVGASMRSFWVGMTAILAAMGLGVVNEIVEFTAVVVAPETGVGGYYNTALDLVFNTIGAIIAIVGFTIVRRLTR